MTGTSDFRIGIDMGGTKLEGVLLGPSGELLARKRRPSPRGDYARTLAAVADLVATLERETGVSARVGVGIPGAISPATGRIKNANSTWLIDRPLDRDLARALRRPVRLANDANCLAVSEATDGAGAGAEILFAVILGTGVGGGVAVRGRCLTGANAIAGEWGHNPLPGERGRGPACYCGRHGCIETYLSGPGLARDHLERTGETLTAALLARRAAAGEPRARASLDHYMQRLARALATVINLLDPNVIVLGGGLSNIAELYTEVPALWRTHVFSDRVDTRLAAAKFGDSSGVRGAAWLWPADPERE